METGATVFYNGLEQDPRLDHPEGVAVHPSDGSVWCGGEAGQIYRIAPDGSGAEQVASVGGFVLGITFLGGGDSLLVCDSDTRCLHRLDTCTGSLADRIYGVGGHRFEVPNYAVELPSGHVLVSDSGSPDAEGPGILLVRADGTGTMWHEGPFAFANGIAVDPSGRWLYVAETYVRRISRVSLTEVGLPPEPVVSTGDHLPDGVTFGPDGNLYIACYEPSTILRLVGDSLEVVARDPTAHVLCHPTNIAFRGRQAFVANLGAWHISTFEV